MKARDNHSNAEHQEVDLVSSTYRLVRRGRRRRVTKTGVALGAIAAMGTAFGSPAGARTPFLANLAHQSVVASTVPQSAANAPGDGDVNPYGVAVVPRSVGRLVKGDVLVSNFNNAANQQGRGSTIVEVAPGGRQTVFARLADAAPGGVGLTTALAVLPHGYVVVGSLPTGDGTSATARAGAVIIVDSRGRPVRTLAGKFINGPWDLTAVNRGGTAELFVTNVLNGTVAANGQVVNGGTVVRIGLDLRSGVPREVSRTVIGSGFAERTDPAALVVGPTGVALGRDGTLFVADTVDNRITAIPDALVRATDDRTGTVVASGGALNGPLGLAVAPDGDLLSVNGGDGNIVETAPSGPQAATRLLDPAGTPPGAGALFGLALAPHSVGVYFVDDDANTLNLLSRTVPHKEHQPQETP